MPKLTPILETAKAILKESRKALHVREMAEIAVKSNRNFGMDIEALTEKFAGALSANLSTREPSFSKPKNKDGGLRKGIYRLKTSELGPRVSAKDAPPPPQVNTNFMGRAGEHAVMSELLFWGFNASLMTVDEGIDIVASKSNHYFHLQVKTATETEGRRYAFKMKASAFATHDAGNTFYVFVLRRKGGSDYAILPSTHIGNLRRLGIIGGTNDLSITISCDEKRGTFQLNNSDDISLFVNNFGLIR